MAVIKVERTNRAEKSGDLRVSYGPAVYRSFQMLVMVGFSRGMRETLMLRVLLVGVEVTLFGYVLIMVARLLPPTTAWGAITKGKVD